MFCIGGNEPQFSARLAVCFESGWPLRNSITWGRPLRSLPRPRRRPRLLMGAWSRRTAKTGRPGPTHQRIFSDVVDQVFDLPAAVRAGSSICSRISAAVLPSHAISRGARCHSRSPGTRPQRGQFVDRIQGAGMNLPGNGYCLYAIRCCEMSSAAAFRSGMNFLNSALGEWRARFVDRLMAAMVLPLAP